MLIMLVVIILFGLLINALLQLFIKGPRDYGETVFIMDNPMHETFTLPKNPIRDTHWHIKTFHRPRKNKLLKSR